MAQVLLVDPNETARKAMQGILARGGHRFAAVPSLAKAIDLIRRNVRVDLVFSELKLAGGDGGIALVRQLKANPLLKDLPIVIYTEHADRDGVRRALDLHVQNILVKPFQDDAIFAEIERAEENPWRGTLFEEEKSFCRLMGLTTDQLHEMLAEVRSALAVAVEGVRKAAELRDHSLVANAVNPVREQAEAAGAWGVVEGLNKLTEITSAGSWSMVPSALADLEFAGELIAHWIDPHRACPDFMEAEEETPVANVFARERAEWLAAPANGRCPLLNWAQIQQELDALQGCPTIDSAAAAFQMAANGHPSCINPLMDLVARDPGLTTEMLIAANKAHPPADEFSRIEDARLAVGQLGEFRLQEEAHRLVQVDQHTFALQPAMSWASYWTFTRGVARISQLICRDLEFYSLEAAARTVGQIHDLGLLLLARLHPAGFQAILEHARVFQQPLRKVEKLYLDCTTPQMAAYFADRSGLSRRFANVMRWLDDPAAATEDKHLVAIVSLARDLCRRNGVGTSGDPLLDDALPLEQTAEWAILREGLYPSFNLSKFEQQVHSYCEQLRVEFSGHRSGTVGEIVARARE